MAAARSRRQLELLILLTIVYSAPVPSCQAIRVKTKRKKPTTTQTSSEQAQRESSMKKERSSWIWNQTSTVSVEPPPPHDVGSDTLYTMIQESIDSVYDSILEEIRPLRGMWDGVLSAASLCWTGYYQGFEGLVFDYPLKGYSNDGILGLMGGTLVGAFHFGVMTTSGVAAGLYQLMRGAERTVAALHFTKEGKIWDKEHKDWKFYSLEEEAGLLLWSTGDDSTSNKQNGSNKGTPMNRYHQKPDKSPRRLRKRVKDQSFYDLLQVPVDASPTQIKKAYYQKAMHVHPDKSSESEAAQNFQTLSTVYKTLVSEETRELYDTHGVCFQDHISNDNNNSHVDPYTFFAIVFGSHVVEPYVGDLAIASIVDNTLSLTERAAPEQLSLDDSNYVSPQQIRRQIQIALHLHDRIEDFVSGHDTTITTTMNDFQQSAKAEAQSLAIAMDGKIESGFFLRAIGSGLILETKQHLDPAWKRHLGGWVTEAIETSKNAKAVESLYKAIRHATLEAAAEESQRETNNYNTMKDKGDENTQEDEPVECNKDQISADMDALILKLSVPRVFQLVWEFNVQDISRTVRAATKKVLDDCADDKELRLIKARALNALGHEFHLAVRTRPKTTANKSREDKKEPENPDAQTIRETVKAALLDSVIQNVPHHTTDEWDEQ